MKILQVIWRFGRPHTIIGSIISIFTLFYIASEGEILAHIPLLFMAILIGVTCNLFIVGINQIEDIDIDRINKPYLPIPSGDLSKKMAFRIVVASLLISLSLAAYLSIDLFFIVLFSTGIGWAYSCQPLYFKKHHLSAALSIVMVRGVFMNIGGYMVFRKLLNHPSDLSLPVAILSGFVILYTFVISWFKDLSDLKGDSQFRLKTLAIVYTPNLVLKAGVWLMVFAYLSAIVLFVSLIVINVQAIDYLSIYLAIGHLVLLISFLVNYKQVKLNELDTIKQFYKRFWLFFFAEYLMFLLGYLVFGTSYL